MHEFKSWKGTYFVLGPLAVECLSFSGAVFIKSNTKSSLALKELSMSDCEVTY